MTTWSLQPKKKHFVVYTDGSYLHSCGRSGGWAALIIVDGEITELSGYEKNTTNNRMELMGPIKALQSIAASSIIDVFTDSQYVRNGIRSWVHGWKRRNWMTAEKKPVLNKDLWLILDAEQARHLVNWHWVRGHEGDAYNERCDVLAREAAETLWSFNGQYETKETP